MATLGFFAAYGLGAASLAFGGFVLRVGYVFIPKVYIQLRRKNIKKNLKKELRKNIEDLDYNAVKDTIYKIQNYDDEYHKDLYVKVKKLFFLTEYHLSCKTNFNRRFNPNYNFDEELKEVIREVSISLSKNQIRLDL